MTRGLPAMLALCAFVCVAVQPGRADGPPAASPVASPVASPLAIDLDAMIRALADESLCVPLDGMVASTAIHSSRDQGSVSREESISWFSEADSGNAIRIDRVDGRSEWVLAELVGAGAITRIVVSSPAAMRDAVLRVWVDGGAQPAFEWPLRELEGVIAPRFAPFVAWHPAKDLPREGDVGGGTIDCILPMPFARSCIVTLDRRPELYRIESIAFADGVRVEPFARESLEGIGDARFAAVRADVAARASLRPTAQSVVRARSAALPSLAAELSASLLAPATRNERFIERERGGVIRRVAIRIDPMQARTAVRELWVECDFDGEPTIRMPLGHFIGLGESTGPTADAFRAVGPDGSMEFRLPMPFARSARVAIANRGAAPLACALEIVEVEEIVRADASDSAARPQLLHGAVRLHNRIAVERPVELELARIEGAGTLVGESAAHHAALRDWWPSGDDRMLVDGRDELAGPSFDLSFGSAPGLPRVARGALVSIPARTDTSISLRWSASRLRRLDAVRFTDSLVQTLELIPAATAGCEVSLSHAVLWYARAGESRGVGFDDPGRMPAVATPRNAAPLGELFPLEAGAEWFEAENLAVSFWTKSAYWGVGLPGVTSPAHAWGSGERVGLQAIGVGDAIELSVPARDAGPRRLEVRFVRTLEAARVAVTVNGTRVAGEFALTSPTPEPSDIVDLGVHAPKDGRFLVRFIAAGYGEGSRTRMQIGVDGIRVSPP
jgi:hypothetical protein